MTTLADLTPDGKNANRHSPRGLDMVQESLQKFGAGRSILVDKHGNIIAGNLTAEAAGLAGLEDVILVDNDGTKVVAVRRTDLDINDPQARALAVADNRSAEVSLTWDADVLQELAGEGVDLDQFWHEDELAALLAEVTQTDGGLLDDADPDAIPDASEVETRVKSGDLWQLGRHRLLCGDSTDPGAVALLMGGEKASLVMTSPPYWVGKEYEQEHTWPEVLAFISEASKSLSEFTTHRIVINTGAPQAAHLTGQRAHVRLLLDEWARNLEPLGWLLRYVRIWSKRGGLVHTAPVSDCIDQHWEFIGVFYRPENYEGQRRLGESWATDGIWDDTPGEMSSHGHCAAFPVEIPRRNILLYTDRGANVLEPFCGAGTTLMACEVNDRRCFAMELLPKYADLTLTRWEQGTGKAAVLLENVHAAPD